MRNLILGVILSLGVGACADVGPTDEPINEKGEALTDSNCIPVGEGYCCSHGGRACCVAPRPGTWCFDAVTAEPAVE